MKPDEVNALINVAIADLITEAQAAAMIRAVLTNYLTEGEITARLTAAAMAKPTQF